MKAAATLVAVCLAALGAGCAGPASTIVDDPFDISETTGAPEISAIVDAGGGDVTLAGPLAMEPSDGVAVIGETLWVRGRSFGRQPTVQVGGRPAAVLGRTRDGGLVVRVPAGTPSGAQAVVVSNEVGKSERPVNVRRYAAVLAPGSGQIGWSELGADGPVATGTTPVPGGRWLALSSDGRAGRSRAWDIAPPFTKRLYPLTDQAERRCTAPRFRHDRWECFPGRGWEAPCQARWYGVSRGAVPVSNATVCQRVIRPTACTT